MAVNTQSEIQRHKKLIEQAERENWALKPIPLDVKISEVLGLGLTHDFEDWKQRRRKRG